MDVGQHPEYDLYHRDAALVAACRHAVDAWIEGGEVIYAAGGVRWTPDRARAFVGEIGSLFRRYNLVLWQSFDYCRRCGGGCCVRGASQVTVFDALALALLAQPFPELAARAGGGDCIYLGAQGCRWPAQWRPIKCWSFYCLGSGDWEIDATDARYAGITQALQDVVSEHLPHYLQGEERGGNAPLAQFLTDPIAFADALGAALFELFVAPFAAAHYLDAVQASVARAAGIGATQGPDLTSDEALSFIAAAVENLWQNPVADGAVSVEQLMGDLERLEWIVLQRPPGARSELQALSSRYGHDHVEKGTPAGNAPLAQQIAQMTWQLLGQFSS